jgi:deoxycytidylate deaminase
VNTIIADPPGSGPCVKGVVKATLVATDGTRYVGTNYCMNPQTVCPRGDMPSGVGYELCIAICKQVGHAEVNAVNAAGENARGGTVYVEGHTYACNNCKDHASNAGALVVVASPPKD